MTKVTWDTAQPGGTPTCQGKGERATAAPLTTWDSIVLAQPLSSWGFLRPQGSHHPGSASLSLPTVSGHTPSLLVLLWPHAPSPLTPLSQWPPELVFCSSRPSSLPVSCPPPSPVSGSQNGFQPWPRQLRPLPYSPIASRTASSPWSPRPCVASLLPVSVSSVSSSLHSRPTRIASLPHQPALVGILCRALL